MIRMGEGGDESEFFFAHATNPVTLPSVNMMDQKASERSSLFEENSRV